MKKKLIKILKNPSIKDGSGGVLTNMELEKLKFLYATQDNRGTAYPFYVQVQELRFVGVMADGYSASCPFGDGETIIEYKHDSYEESFKDKQELLDLCWEDCENERVHKDNYIYHFGKEIEEINCGYVWHPVEFFLTIKGAEEYMAANKHNHGKLRTYVAWFERRNYEMRGLLKLLGFKTNDSMQSPTTKELYPIGSIIPTDIQGKFISPDGVIVLECNGQIVKKTEFPDLYEMCQSHNHKTPDLRPHKYAIVAGFIK